MGTASFHVGTYARTRGNGAASIASTNVRVSGAHTTSGTASALTDSTAAAVTLASGEILKIHASVAMRVRFGGIAATATTGIYLDAGDTEWLECDDPGAVSIIDA